MNYKKLFLDLSFCFLCLAFVSVLGNSEPDGKGLFSKANQAYKKGDFKKAMELYMQIPEKGSSVNYNIGNCAYKQNMLGQALLYWRRAEKEWGLAERGELLANIRLLKSKIGGQLRKKESAWKQKPFLKFFIRLKDYSVSLIRSLPIIFFQLIFLFLWFFLFLFVRFLYKKKSRVVISFLFSFVLLFGVTLGLRYCLDLSKYAVVLQKTDLWSGPSLTFQKIGFVPLAQEVNVKKESGEFLKIKFNGQIGWVEKRFVEKI